MRTLVAVTCLVTLAAGCGRARDVSPDSGAARAALDRYVIDFWVKRDQAALGRALSESMVYHYNGRVIPGDPEAHRKALASFGGAFPDLAATVDVFTMHGDLGAAVTTWTGTHTGGLCQTPGTGTKASWVVNYVFRVADGRIVELWEAWDEGGTHRKLGIDSSNCG
jgi:predicted ester cyclase